VDPRIDVRLWQQNAMARGVFFQIGSQFTLDGSHVQSVRLGYAFLDEEEASTGVERLARCVPPQRRRR
jgi:DNA-binding transcriptional MocR family regulator